MTKRARGKEVKGKTNKENPKCKIYIFAEGKTERIYLEHFENRSYNVEIIPVNSEHTDAYGIVCYAKQYISENKLDLDLGDRGYCVFDSDPKSNTKIKETFNLLFGWKEKGLEFIFSNPSFEVWFALHFGHAPYGLSAKDMKKHVKSLVKTEFPKYSETTDIFNYLLDKQPEAFRRAIKLHKEQEKVHDSVYSHECNPYTNMFKFIEHMEAVKKSFSYEESKSNMFEGSKVDES